MSTSKKDYMKVASLINAKRDLGPEVCDTLRELAIDLAIYFAEDNPRFEQSKFMKACGF